MAPSACCGTSNSADQCTCGCPPLLNGALQLLVAQVLVFMGWWFSLATLGDCSFVTIPGGYVPEVDPDNLPNNLIGEDSELRRGIGMFTFEDVDGRCYWYTYDYYNDDDWWSNNNDEIAEDYILNFLGSSWASSQVTASIPAGLGWFLFVYLLSYCCSTQIRPFRYGTGVFLCIFFTVMQGLSFIVFGTTWCSTKECDFSRSAGFSIGALLCYFIAGLTFFVMKDYPGADAVQAIAGVKQVDDDDEEAAAEAVVVEDDKDADEEPKEEQAPSPEEAGEEAADATDEAPADSTNVKKSNIEGENVEVEVEISEAMSA
eukprot:CAMPEP_0194026994 /NCGR_PEP_ID=MMETSP0009_2-20130614/1232_1 /TAXON_ID=210454 /ORGANISM="Grammatophora oceanica, Strain CCMP 410" /LENGTH=315 /DNA_ID=CAMNT_0038665915 /DNA_START=55 /DNA_END=1002 /DNA_ORIENTATION=-